MEYYIKVNWHNNPRYISFTINYHNFETGFAGNDIENAGKKLSEILKKHPKKIILKSKGNKYYHKFEAQELKDIKKLIEKEHPELNIKIQEEYN